MRDPIRAWRLRAGFSVLASAVAVCLAAAWALRPIAALRLPEIRYQPAEAQEDDLGETAQAIDPALFAVQLWATPVDAVSEDQTGDAKLALEQTLELELIGITVVDQRRIAALYDREADRFFLVADGEELHGRPVTVLARSLQLEGADGPVELALAEAPE